MGDRSYKSRMKSVEDTTQTARSSTADSTLRVSQRDVLITGGASVSLLATTGVSTGSNHETSSEAESLTATVTGLEIDGPLEGCVVEHKNERKTTDESGTVVFENGDGPYEVTLEKKGWHDKTATVEAEGINKRSIFPCTSTIRLTTRIAIGLPSEGREKEQISRRRYRSGDRSTLID